MPEKNYPSTIHLSEAVNTWGCHYTIPDSDEVHYGFGELPNSLSLWLDCVQGDAVEQIIKANLGEVISSRRGNYGGEKRTVSVDVNTLEDQCRKYWDKQNELHQRHVEQAQHCHYCGGSPVVRTGFFGESACTQCS